MKASGGPTWKKYSIVTDHFRGEGNVFPSGFLEQIGPFVRIPQLGFEHGCKILELEILAIGPDKEIVYLALERFLLEPVSTPFRIFCLLESAPEPNTSPGR